MPWKPHRRVTDAAVADCNSRSSGRSPHVPGSVSQSAVSRFILPWGIVRGVQSGRFAPASVSVKVVGHLNPKKVIS